MAKHRGRPESHAGLDHRGRLQITGRTWGEQSIIAVNVPPLMRDALKMYSIVKGLPSGAKGAIYDLMDSNEQLQSIKSYLAKEQGSEKRAEIIKELAKGDGDAA